jgi:hypothetical protein
MTKPTPEDQQARIAATTLLGLVESWRARVDGVPALQVAMHWSARSSWTD